MVIPTNANVIGYWSDVFAWPLIGLHAAEIIPDGKVLTFGTDLSGVQGGLHDYDVWDPITNTHTTLQHNTNSDIFCAAALIIEETGEILIGRWRLRGPFGGGQRWHPRCEGVYDPSDMSLMHSPTGPMDFARWYGMAVEGGERRDRDDRRPQRRLIRHSPTTLTRRSTHPAKGSGR